MIKDKLKTRNAFTLIEMVVVIALLGVVMSVATAMIIGLMQFSSSEVGLANKNMEVASLAGLFRNDVRLASSALITVNDDKTFKGLKLVLPSGGEITYEVENDLMMRVSPQGKQRLMGIDSVGNISFQIKNNGSVVEFSYEDKGVYSRFKVRTFTFCAALNRGLK